MALVLWELGELKLLLTKADSKCPIQKGHLDQQAAFISYSLN